MKRRTAWLIIGALAILCVAMVFSVVYPFSTTDLADKPSVATEFDDGDPVVYNYSVTHITDEGAYTKYAGVATESGAAHGVVVIDDSRVERYRQNWTAPVYSLHRYSSRSTYEYGRTRAVEDPQLTIITDSTDGDRYTLVTRRNSSSDDRDHPFYPPGISGGFLEAIPFDRVRETGETITYEPRNAWLEDHRKSYRVTDATGSITVDETSQTIVEADISWTQTAPAETYAGYVLGRIVDTDQERESFSYTYDTTTDPDIDTPDWVEDDRT